MLFSEQLPSFTYHYYNTVVTATLSKKIKMQDSRDLNVRHATKPSSDITHQSFVKRIFVFFARFKFTKCHSDWSSSVIFIYMFHWRARIIFFLVHSFYFISVTIILIFSREFRSLISIHEPNPASPVSSLFHYNAFHRLSLISISHYPSCYL